MSRQLTARLLSPIAADLPETMNALIWVRQGKEWHGTTNKLPPPARTHYRSRRNDGGLDGTLYDVPQGSVRGRQLVGMPLLYGVFAAAIALS